MLTAPSYQQLFGLVRFHATKHFYQRWDERDLSFQACKDAISYPDSVTTQPGTCNHGGKRKIFRK